MLFANQVLLVLMFSGFAVAIALKYVELINVGHMWGMKADVNEAIWEFFDDHPLEKKYEPSGRDQH